MAHTGSQYAFVGLSYLEVILMSLVSVLMAVVPHSPVAVLPVECSVSLANEDAF